MRKVNDLALITAGQVAARAICSFDLIEKLNILPSLEIKIQGLGGYGRLKI
jgi:hypothetical protein